MDAPPVQYVTTSDGYSIAYAVSGKGTPLLFLPGAFNHVQLAWEYPRLEAWVRGLAARFRLIQLDPRGFGLSSRDVGENLAREDYLKDVEAVIDRLKLDRFLIVAVSNGVNEAVDFTLQHPDKVIGLVLGTLNFRWATALFDQLPAQDWDAFLHSIVPRDRSTEERNRLVELRRQAEDNTTTCSGPMCFTGSRKRMPPAWKIASPDCARQPWQSTSGTTRSAALNRP
jgi:pimeloyl-ACP methyl ester carboxylesterase